MSTAMNFGSKAFKPRAPEKGSFPLDHLGECKDFKEKFMKCLRDSSFDNSQCRLQSKDYLECRMKKHALRLRTFCSQCSSRKSDGADVRTQQEILHRKHRDQLMAQEPLEKLGFKDLVDAPPNQADTDSEP